VKIAIRAARPEDWEAMREIFRQAGQAAWSHILPAAALAELSAPDRWNPRTGTDVLVADDGYTVVGLSAFAPQEMTMRSHTSPRSTASMFSLRCGARAWARLFSLQV
jgi:hypothetical protein